MGRKKYRLCEIDKYTEGAFASRVTVSGGSVLRCENHRGVQEYGEDYIVLSLSRGRLCIWGGEMKIAAMNRRDILIRGKIKSLDFQEGINEN